VYGVEDAPGGVRHPEASKCSAVAMMGRSRFVSIRRRMLDRLATKPDAHLDAQAPGIVQTQAECRDDEQAFSGTKRAEWMSADASDWDS